jgi:hypothetical protein
LRHLDSNVLRRDVGWRVLSERQTSHSLRGHLDQIDTHDLRDEWEGPRGTDVALDDLDLVVLGDELNVKWAGNVKGSADLLCRVLDLAYGLKKC